MNKSLFLSVMVKNQDTQGTLAKAMGLSLSRLNAKINERGGAAFTQTEIAFIIQRYGLTNDEAMEIFFLLQKYLVQLLWYNIMKPEQSQLDAEIERCTIRNLADMVREFYKDPKNRQAYEVWKNSKEAQKYADYLNS